MNKWGLSWRDAYLIRASLLGLMVATLSAGLVLLFTQGLLHHYRSQLQPLQARLNAIHTAADTARTAWGDTHENQQRYLELVQHGMIGKEEHRLEWVETLAQLQQAEPALKLQYHIDPQRLLEDSKPAGSTALFSSRMTVHYAALHEEDFSRVHHNLRQAPGWLAATRCVIDRPPESAARLEIECDYDWFSIAPGAKAKGKESVAR